MVQFARSLVSWLAATGQTSRPAVLSCSQSSIEVADGSLAVGDIFIHVDSASSELCRNDCSALFREILSDEGNGVYKTAPASFSQVLQDTISLIKFELPQTPAMQILSANFLMERK